MVGRTPAGDLVLGGMLVSLAGGWAGMNYERHQNQVLEGIRRGSLGEGAHLREILKLSRETLAQEARKGLPSCLAAQR